MGTSSWALQVPELPAGRESPGHGAERGSPKNGLWSPWVEQTELGVWGSPKAWSSPGREPERGTLHREHGVALQKVPSSPQQGTEKLGRERPGGKRSGRTRTDGHRGSHKAKNTFCSHQPKCHQIAGRRLAFGLANNSSMKTFLIQGPQAALEVLFIEYYYFSPLIYLLWNTDCLLRVWTTECCAFPWCQGAPEAKNMLHNLWLWSCQRHLWQEFCNTQCGETFYNFLKIGLV